jgi:hypothetical protein
MRIIVSGFIGLDPTSQGFIGVFLCNVRARTHKELVRFRGMNPYELTTDPVSRGLAAHYRPLTALIERSDTPTQVSTPCVRLQTALDAPLDPGTPRSKKIERPRGVPKSLELWRWQRWPRPIHMTAEWSFSNS